MSRVGYEPTIPVFVRTKTVHALDRAAAVIGWRTAYNLKRDEKWVEKLVYDFWYTSAIDLD
jgi:hypothetical protein